MEGLKKILDEAHKKYATNLLAATTAVLVSAAVCIGYIILSDTVVNLKVIVEAITIMYLGFLIATVGYDKVIQTISQIRK